MARQQRKRQISCHFCRMRKLRCNREFPCSNCTSRGVACPEPQHAATSDASAVRPAPAKKPVRPNTGDPDIQNRLERLEGLLQGLSRQLESVPELAAAQPPMASFAAPPFAPPPPPPPPPPPVFAAPVVAPSQAQAQTQTQTQTHPQTHPHHHLQAHHLQQPLPLKIQDLTNNALLVEEYCIVSKTSNSIFSDHVIFRACPIRSITQLSSFTFQSPGFSSSIALTAEPTRCIWLPNRDEADALVQKYMADISPMHHFIHGPHLRRLVTELYASLKSGSQVPVGTVVLLLAICAIVTYSWTPHDDEKKLFQDSKEANSQTLIWVKILFNLLEICQRNDHSSIECVQGLTLLTTTLFNLEGISPTARAMLARAIFLSRELGLHRIDHPDTDSFCQKYPPLTRLTAEVGRRLWWHLVGVDWMLARFPGPQEGTYLVNPNQMAVRKPANINDEDLDEDREIVDKPMDQPTIMSYSLHRIRFLELFREFTDRTTFSKPSSASQQYDTVLQMDAAIDRFMAHEASPFFRIDVKELEKLPPDDPWRSPTAIINRYMYSFYLYSQCCRLHLPYLARGTVDPAYAHSRQACLRSARIITQRVQQLVKEEVGFAHMMLRLGVAMHGLFLATIALVFDLCLTNDVADDGSRQQEVEHAWRTLENAEVQSSTVARGMNILRHIMEKYKIPFPTGVSGHHEPIQTNGHTNYIPQGQIPADAMGMPAGMPLAKPHHTEQEIEGHISKMDLEDVDWERLCWEFDAPFI
ncbi:hypothetical protein EDB81DRAFT_773544 [Dactylonectria macrodidyma]|uniref:Zn(2)-C6 fungal-type domain-containing protein n=1 Tax=Dactylonectria macrodidyma TaxID=307937 RepID=A0A9P9FSZ1_9HYPO|nr:hypothetical protein EDB81DRAFT_773544 [Dactylonectria macrodidyma]